MTTEIDELNSYLNSKNLNASLMNDYINLKKLFIQYNTALPSSASCERLFSTSGLILTSRSGNMSDAFFEKKVLLHWNKKY